MSNITISPVEAIRFAIKDAPNIKEVDPPFSFMYYPSEEPLSAPHPDVLFVYKAAEVSLLMKLGIFFDPVTWREIWSFSVRPRRPTMEVPSLAVLAAACFSPYNRSFMNDHGRRPAVSAMSGMYPEKIVKTIKKLIRDPHSPPDMADITPFLDEALEFLYYAMDTRKYWGKFDAQVQLDALDGLYLGASNGRLPGSKREIKTPDGHRVVINPSGKKYENMEASFHAVQAFLNEGTRFPVTFAVIMKNEIKHLPMHSPEVPLSTWTAANNKLRMVMIANGPFVLLERVLTRTRQFLEHGNVIRVGGSWSHGGMDFVARCLGAYDDPEAIEAWEADVDGLDLSVKEFLMELYWIFNSVYFKPGTAGYKKMRDGMTFIIEESLNRLTALFYDIWVMLKGQVPSGFWNTSHMDSWCVALLFFWFVAYQLRKKTAGGSLNKKQRREIYVFLRNRIIAIIVYGDDNLASYPKGHWISSLLNYYEWDKWLWRYWGMRLRDIRRSRFLSTVRNGVLISRGATFLRHQAIANPNVAIAGQPKYLPFRETQEIMVRLGWGREPKSRDLLDLSLSIVGHAWGTFASNRLTYDWLKSLFEAVLSKTGLTANSLVSQAFGRATEDDMRQMRHKGLDPSVIITGFPSWPSLVKQNTVDPSKEFFAKLYL